MIMAISPEARAAIWRLFDDIQDAAYRGWNALDLDPFPDDSEPNPIPFLREQVQSIIEQAGTLLKALDAAERPTT